jgi:PTS system mannose-specific IID component
VSLPAALALRVPAPVLARCFWRGLFLQAAWNRRGMQNLGFAFAIDPALRALYTQPERRREALARHLGFFNCHPYTAAAILGGAIHHEEKAAAGAEPASAAISFKATLQGPLAALGDGFFWTALRPFFGALAALGALLLGWPAVVAALLVYNAIHLALRAGLFWTGYRQGDALVPALARLALPVMADRLRVGGAALCGVAAIAGATRAEAGAHGGAAALAAVAAGIGYLALARGVRLLPATYAAIAAGVGVGLVVFHLRGSL